MLAIKHLVTTAILAAVMPTIAAPIFLDFEKSPLEAQLAGDIYKDLGVVFTDNAYTLHSNLIDPKPMVGGNFIRYSDPASKAALFLGSTAGASSTNFFINVAAGFGETFRMLYTTTLVDGGPLDAVELFSGENGTGNALSSRQLTKQAPCRNPAGELQPGVYCTWVELALDFTGTAKSVHVSGTSGLYFFDNVNFGPLASTPSPGTDVPEPAGIALSLAALGALAWTRKRYQR